MSNVAKKPDNSMRGSPLMANPSPVRSGINAPWCPNCKQPLGPGEIGSYNARDFGILTAGLSVVFCRKCGVILGAAGVQ